MLVNTTVPNLAPIFPNPCLLTCLFLSCLRPPPIPASKGASTWLGVSMLAVLALITATSLAGCARLGGRLNTYKGAMSRLR